MSEPTRQFLLAWAKRKRLEAEAIVLEARGNEEAAKSLTLEAEAEYRLADDLERLARTLPPESKP